MRPRDDYKGIKIEGGDLIARIKNFKQKDWLNACQRLGLRVSASAGRGSHAVVYRHDCDEADVECCLLTLPRNLHPGIQRDLFKKALGYGLEAKLYSEKSLWEALGIKVR